MTVAKLLMYGLSDEENYLTEFYFDINQVQGFFINRDLDYISVIISGQIYELEYNLNLLNEIKNTLNIKTLGLN